MAQKRRGLGRGLEALIPDSQKETSTPTRRPSDVFFPESRAEEDASQEGEASEEQSERRGRDLTASLMAPRKREKTTRPRRAAKTEEPARATKTASKASVSRETRSKRNSSEKPRSTTSRARARAEDAEATRAEALPAEDAGSEAPIESVSEIPTDQKQVSASSSVESVDDVSRETEAETEDEGLVPVPGATFASLPVDVIQPNRRQPRQVFDEDDIAELAASIREVGLLQPIVVRRSPEDETHYELIMGERRLRAAKDAGLETIPAVVRDTDEVDLLRDALLENLHRVQLNPLEEAAAYQQLLEDFNCTHAELSERIARSRSQISNTLRLMKLPPLVQRRLAAGVISAGHARALLGLANAALMERLAQRVVAEGLSVRATEELVALQDEPEVAEGQPRVLRARSTPLPGLSNRLSDAFDTRVKVTRGAKKGRITIEFAGQEDLARIISALAPGTSLDED
ncbi:ParB/RepB/Spo0J family partition protein [Actinomyces slackii]|uniref:Probable chromosome-partitioning protein parB n=1 Tax=Actinomyces slackii TaxID=52774 RepID=A0A448KAH5_9ACTO|nr:ParB/RepB/Spo0J family partition protein [Actinomyces slackii]VEG73924.1 Probable chromosome-partitioning protein parB [Actinomyces slackii]